MKNKFDRILVMIMIVLLTADLTVGHMYITASEIPPEKIPVTTEQTEENQAVKTDMQSDSEEASAVSSDLTDTLQTTSVPDQKEDAQKTDQETAVNADEQTPVVSQDEADVPDAASLSYEDDDVIVTASAKDADAIPEGASLKVTPILKDAKETADLYKEVDAKLAEKSETEDYDVAGFVAYDISLVDQDGKEIEPSGAVKVTMDYKNPVIPEELKDSEENYDVTVMHLQEDGKGNVNAVVDLANVPVEGKAKDVTENKIDTIQTTNAQQVEKTEFVTDSFSTFVISWSAWSANNYKDYKVTVHYVDQNGNELNRDLVDPKDITITNTKSIALVDYKKSIQGYTFSRICRDNPNNGTETSKLQPKKSSEYYIYADSGTWLSSSKKAGDIYIVYEKNPPTLEIEDQVLTSGKLVPNIMDGDGETPTSYTWYRSDSEQGTYTAVERVEYQGGYTNVEADGSALYPAFDNGAQKWYKVSTILSDGTMIESAPFQVPYYNQLQNGSFEKPVYNNRTAQVSNAAYKADEGVWQTTGIGSGSHATQDIEIVNTDYSGYKSAYSWHGSDKARDGKQFAELNCEATGALYQDVLTTPGSALNYWFSHRARGKDANKTEYDTMYLIIMPTQIAKTAGNGQGELDTQAELKSYIQKVSGIDISPTGSANAEENTVLYNVNGIYVARITSDDLNWHDISNVGDYVSTDSLTRFFFVAGQTASNNDTIGNFLDYVGFSQELPPVSDDEFSLQIEKKFAGLDDTGLQAIKNQIQFKIQVEDLKTNKTLSESQVKDLLGIENATIVGTDMKQLADGTLYYNLLNKKIGNSDQYKVTITEGNAELAGYSLETTATTSVTYDGQTDTYEKAEIPTLQGKTTAKVSFTNSYDRSENKTIHFKKIWDDRDNEFGTRPDRLDVTLKASVTVANESGTGTQTIQLAELTETATLTAPDWSKDWQKPVYYNYNGVPVKIDYTVEEGVINSDYVYEAGSLQKGTGDDYSFKTFNDVATTSDAPAAKASLKSAFRTLAVAAPLYGTNLLAAGDAVEDLGMPAHTKYIEYNQDTDDYTLNLDVTGKKGTAKGVDVVFVIDRSGSMGEGNGSNYYNILPDLQKLLTKDNGVIDKIFATKEGVANVNSIAYVAFAGSGSGDSGTTVSSWYAASEKSALKTKINSIKANGGTNWTYAMEQASDLLAQKSASENEKVVIFLSDGNPTYTMIDIGLYRVQSGDGSSTKESYYNDAAGVVNGSDSLKDSSFYSVYLTSGTQSGMNKFDGLLSSVKSHECVDGTNLETALTNILNKVIPTYKEVTITDTLSENVVFAEGTNPTITVKKRTAAGAETTLNANEYQTTITGGKVSVKLLNGGSLEDGATYTISFRVKPSEKASEKYSNGGYTETGDANTGVTSAGKEGFYSNEKNTTTVSYQVDGINEQKSATYPMPVVQITTHVLNYEKVWTNVPEGVTVPDSVTYHVTYNDGTTKDITLTAAAGWKASETVAKTKNIQSVTETEIPDYTASYNVSAEKAVVTNSYSKVTTDTIQVQKTWVGDGQKTPINVSLYQTSSDENTVLYDTQTLNDSNEWCYTWEDLVTENTENGKTITYSYAVREETIPAGYTCNIKYKAQDGITVATIENVYDVNCKTENLYIANVLQTEQIVLEKQWNDNNDALKVRPTSLPITVKGGAQDLTFNLDSNKNWTKTVTLLQMKNTSYTAEEDLSDISATYEQEQAYQNGNKFVFVNKLKTKDITVQKVWNDGLNDASRPGSIAFDLQYSKNGGTKWEKEPYGQYTITAENAGWTITISNLPAVYQYRVSESVTTDTAYHSSVSGIDDDNKITITNTLNWSVRKTSEAIGDADPKPLAGGTFELKNGNTVIATGTSGEDGVIAWTVKTGQTVDLQNLDGTYLIHETKAPAGYACSSTDWTLTFDKGLLTKLNGTAVTGNKTNGVVVDITNKMVYELPKAGGSGIFGFTFGGVLLMICAAGMMLLYNKKKSEGGACS